MFTRKRWVPPILTKDWERDGPNLLRSINEYLLSLESPDSLYLERENGTWTPADGSGAGLSFTNVGGSYVRLGNLVTVRCSLTYPVTADGTAAQISGLPYASTATYYGTAGIYTNSGTATIALIGPSVSSILLYNAASAAALTNANVSADTLIMTLSYEIDA